MHTQATSITDSKQDELTEGRPTDQQPIARLVDVHKAFGSLVVLDGISLDFYPGRTTVVLGPSGTGKSVLLKHVAGLLHPDKGEVWFEDQRIDTMKPRDLVGLRQKLGYLFQLGALFDSMNVQQNITFPLEEHAKISRDEMNDRCATVLKQVGLPGIEYKMPSDLSGGQKKRVALARAIVLEPDLVLYDEPTTGLDPINCGLIDELMNNLRDRLGITGLVVTHDMNSARAIADRIVMLNHGQIIADAEADKFGEIEDDFVQRFIKGQASKEDLERLQEGF